MFSVGAPSEALACFFSECLNVYRLSVPADHPAIADVLELISMANARLGKISAAMETDVSSNALRRRSQLSCAGPGCARSLREEGAPLDQCAGCLRTYHCSVACQRADWKTDHKAECKVLAAEGVGAGNRMPAPMKWINRSPSSFPQYLSYTECERNSKSSADHESSHALMST